MHTWKNFYPRSPCGERLVKRCQASDISDISIHALLAESDDQLQGSRNSQNIISIHALLAESDGCQRPCGRPTTISIHALLAESDIGPVSFFQVFSYFYPRSPCGERQRQIDQKSRSKTFLSTLSLRRATSSIRESLSGSTFLSTLSLRRATAKVHKTVGHFCAYETNFMGIASSC